MNTTGSAKCAGALAALALCSACAGGAAVAPSAAAQSGVGYMGKTAVVNGIPVTAAHPNLSRVPRYLTTVPEGPVLPNTVYPTRQYIINFYGSYASIFHYPKTTAQVGTINNVGGQGCTNVLYGYGRETFWIVAGADQITEYKVPQKPIKTLSVSSGQPSSCAMNWGGDLAVGNLSNGDIIIFKHASGTGKVYATPLNREYFDGYDNHGNLFFDGLTAGSGFQLDELPKGSTKIQTISTSNTVDFPGSVQWDGTYLTVFDQDTATTYRYTVSGTKATLKGSVKLAGSGDCAQTWIGRGLVICGDSFNNDGSIYKYPAGGSPIAILTGNFNEPLGAVAANR